MLKTSAFEDNWDGSDRDYTLYGQIYIWCTQAPSTPYTINLGSSVKKIPQSALLDTGSGTLNLVPTITTTGRYLIQGNGYININSGSGGSFMISGAQ